MVGLLPQEATSGNDQPTPNVLDNRFLEAGGTSIGDNLRGDRSFVSALMRDESCKN